MAHSKKQPTLGTSILLTLLTAGEIFEDFLSINNYIRQYYYFGEIRYKSRSFEMAARRLLKKGYLKFENQNAKRFIKLTSKGELGSLVKGFTFYHDGKWDGKWRLVMFDIPEDARKKRNMLRNLLKSAQFKRLQNSVYISPYPINSIAVSYLKQKGLQSFIRILLVESIDDDFHLRKSFKLSSS